MPAEHHSGTERFSAEEQDGQLGAPDGPGPVLAYVVRLIEPGDYEPAGRLVVAAYQAIPGNHMSGGYAEQLADVRQRAGEAEVYVAVATDSHGSQPHQPDDAGKQGSAIAGCVTFVPDEHSPWAEMVQPGEAAIRMLAVDPSVQGKGIGQRLLDTCLDRAARLGREAVFLHSTEFMESAHRLYLRAGFVRVPDRDWTPVPDVRLLAFRLALKAN